MLTLWKKFLNFSLCSQLTFLTSFLGGLMLILFMVDIAHQHKKNGQKNVLKQVQNSAYVLAINAKESLNNKNYNVLKKIVLTQKNYPQLHHAMVLSPQGKILAHSDPDICQCLGTFVPQDIQRRLYRTPYTTPQLLMQHPQLIDVAVPIIVNKRTIGWSRIALSQKNFIQDNASFLYHIFIYLTLGLLFLILLIRYLAQHSQRKLQHYADIFEQVRLGQRALRIEQTNHEDYQALVQSINDMLDTIQHSENKHFQHEERLNLALQGSRDSIWDWDLSQQSIYFSSTWGDMLGIHTQEIGNGFSVWRQRIHPDDLAQVMNNIEQHLEGKTAYFDNIHRLRHAKGHYIWIHVRGQACFDEQQQAQRIVGTCIDLTEQKRLEHCFLVLTQQALYNSDVFIQNCLLQLTSTFKMEYGILGLFSDNEQRVVKTVVVLQSGQLVENFEYLLANTPCADAIQNNSVLISECTADHYPQDKMLQEFNVESYFGIGLRSNVTGKKIGVLSVMGTKVIEPAIWFKPLLEIYANYIAFELERENITRIINLSEQSQPFHANTDNNPLSQMHQVLQIPLAHMLNHVELLHTTNLTEQQNHSTQELYTTTEHLQDILSRLLDYSQLNANAFYLHQTDFNLCQLIDTIIQDFTPAIKVKNIELLHYISAQIPCDIHGDLSRLQQIITSLLINAIRFTQQGEIYIKIYRLEDKTNSVKLRFEIEDTGIGLTEDQQNILLMMLQQSHPFTIHSNNQIGLGLIVAQMLTKKMGGELGFKTIADKGSTFWFTVQLKKALQKKQVPLVHFNYQYNCIIVANNAAQRTILQQQLNAWGIQVLFTENNHSALHLLLHNQQIIHFAFIDYTMPDMDGLTFIHTYQAENASYKFPVILLNTGDHAAESNLLQPYNVITVLDKPLVYSEIYHAVCTALKVTPQISIGLPTQKKIEEIPAEVQILPVQACILIVEDSPLNRDVICDMLDKLGYYPDLVTNGKEAVEAVTKKSYDLVFMDCEMPVMDGYTAAKNIREYEKDHHLPHTPIVALTAHAMQEHKIKSQESGMDDHLTKPLRLQTLRSVLQQWLPVMEQKTVTPSLTAHSDSKVIENDKPPSLRKTTEAKNSKDSEYVAEAQEHTVIDYKMLDHLRHVMGGDISPLLQQFIAYAKEQIDGIKKALDQQDAEDVRRKAHQFKGESLQLGANHLGYLCKDIEMLAKDSKLEHIPVYIIKLERELTQVKTALAQAEKHE